MDANIAGTSGPLDATAFNLLEALQEQKPECPICSLTIRAVSSYLDWTAYESVNDPQVREGLRKALGYCALHAQQWLSLKDTLATAIIYRDILTELHRTLTLFVPDQAGRGELEASEGPTVSPGHHDDIKGNEASTAESIMRKLQALLGGGIAASAGSEPGRTLTTSLEPQGPCPACNYTIQVERRLVESCADALPDRRFMQAYEHHPLGLCLPHLRAVLRLVGPREAKMLARFLLNALASTRAELDEVVRKYDYRFRHEVRGREFEAPARSVRLTAGTLPVRLNMPANTQREG